eukprot:782846-Pleurochrysis_carterae.AAC.1
MICASDSTGREHRDVQFGPVSSGHERRRTDCGCSLGRRRPVVRYMKRVPCALTLFARRLEAEHTRTV